MTRLPTYALLAMTLAGAPAFAEKGGNGGGNGNGGGHGNSGNHGASATSHGKSSIAPGKSKAVAVTTDETGSASKFGKLNGFLHASPQALAKASPNSAIGKVAVAYAGLLNSYLAPAEGTTAPAAADVAAALEAAANKPLTAEVITAVNARLLSVNPDLAASLTASGKTPEQLADEIAAAL